MNAHTVHDRYCHRRRNTQGFTMVEVISVVMLIIILFGVLAVNVAQLRRPLKQTELNSVAKEIYVAAQNHLTMAKSQNLIDGRSEQGEVGNSSFDTDLDVKYFVYPTHNPDDKTSVLNLMLPFASLDGTVRTGAGSYLIRYQPKSGRVLDVFYNDGGKNFAHPIVTTEYQDLMAVSDRDGNHRTDRSKFGDDEGVIGYYGGEDALVYSEKDAEAPDIVVENAEKLTVKVDNSANVSGGNLIVSDLNLTVIVEGKTSGAQKEFVLIRSGEQTDEGLKYVITGQTKKGYFITLDDVTVANGHFADVFKDADSTGKKFIPGEDITIQAVATSATSLSNPAYSAKRTTNSLFASVKKSTTEAEVGVPATTKYTASIVTFRHLENLDPNVSSLGANDFESKLPALTDAIQLKDLSWPTFRARAHKDANGIIPAETSTEALSTKVYDKDGNATVEGTYYPVTPGAALAYDGKSHRVSDLKVNAAANAGMFGTFGTAAKASSIANLELVDFYVTSSSNNAGALAGETENTNITGVLVHNSRAKTTEPSLQISADKSAGGLVGSLAGGSVDLSAAAVYVKSNASAGGLIGVATGTTSIANSYSAGHTKQAVYQTEVTGTNAGRMNVIAETKAGGLVGDASAAKLTASNTYSTCSAYTTGTTSVAVAAGLVGTVGTGSTITNSYATGLVGAAGTGAVKGAFVGDASSLSMSADDNNHYLDGISSGVNVVGAGTATGIADMDDTFYHMEDVATAGGTALPYDATLASNFGGKYVFRTISELNTSLGTQTSASIARVANRHVGDWQAPEDSPYDTNVKLNNGDKLTATVSIPEQQIKDGTNELSALIRGATSKKSRYLPLILTKSGDEYTVALNDKVEASAGITAAWVEKVCTASAAEADDKVDLVFTLDSVTDAGLHFAELFGQPITGEDTALIPGENIAIAVNGGTKKAEKLEDYITSGETTSEGKLTESRVLVAQGNSLFADESESVSENDTTVVTAGVSYVRHLQNLDPKISNVTESISGAKLLKSVAWSAQTYPFIYACNSDGHTTNSFYGIYNYKLNTFEGQNYILSDFVINDAPSTIDETGKGNAGLFRLVNNNFTIKDVRADEFVVTSTTGHAAAMVAQASKATNFDTVLVTSKEATVRASGTGKAAGGLVGLAEDVINVTNSAASMLVLASGNAGGLVGEQSVGELAISSSYAGGHTNGNSTYSKDDYNITSESSAAGGLVGYIHGANLVVNNAFSAASVSGTTAGGGIFGQADSATFLNLVYVIAPVNRVTAGSPDAKFGALYGIATSVNNSQTYYLPEIYENNVTTLEGETYVSNIAAYGTGVPANAVELAYYEKDNGIAARLESKRDTLTLATYTYDDSLSGREYPFSSWTRLGFEGQSTSRLRYYGDWQPVKILKATLYEIDPTEEKDPIKLGTQDFVEGKAASLVEPDRGSYLGYVLDGWYYSKDGSEKATFDHGMINVPHTKTTENLSLYARYKRNDTGCFVYFKYKDPKTGEVKNARSVQFVTKGQSATIPKLSIDGYTFLGWYDALEGGNKISDSDLQNVQNDITAYAHLKQTTYNMIKIHYRYLDTSGELRTFGRGDSILQIEDGVKFEDDVAIPSLGDMHAVSITGVSSDITATLSDDNTRIHIVSNTGAAGELTVVCEGRIATSTYTVKHIFEKSYSKEINSTEMPTPFAPAYGTGEYTVKEGPTEGAVGDLTGASALDVPGFDNTGVQNRSIKENAADNIIEIHYQRKQYPIYFNLQSGSFRDPVMVDFGAPIKSSIGADPKRDPYTFAGWTFTDEDGNDVEVGYSTTMPLHSLTATANWSGKASYTVVYWLQKVTGDTNDDYSFGGREVLQGEIGEMTDFKPNAYKFEDSHFYLRSSDPVTNVRVTADGKAIVNVYYDREIMAINFYYASGVQNLAPSGASTPVYKYEKTENYNQTIYGISNEGYGIVQYVGYEDSYRYTCDVLVETTSTEDGNYNIYENGIKRIKLYRNNGKWYKNREWHYDYWSGYYIEYYNEYTGTVYNLTLSNIEYAGQRYKYVNGQLVETSDETGDLYAIIDNIKYNLKVTHTRNPIFKWVNSGELYYGAVYKRLSLYNNDWKKMLTWTGRYGSTFAQNNYGWSMVSAVKWNESSDGKGTTQTYLDSFTNSNNPYNLYGNDSQSADAKSIFHYRENLRTIDPDTGNSIWVNPETGETTTKYSIDNREEAKTSGAGTFNFSNKFNEFTVDSYGFYNFDENGYYNYYGRYRYEHVTESSSVSTVTYPLHVYHTRNTYKLHLYANYPDETGSETSLGDLSVYYQKKIVDAIRENNLSSLENFKLSDSVEYTFAGWYRDNKCTKVLLDNETMPAGDLALYAKWTPPSRTITFNLNKPDGSSESPQMSGASTVSVEYATALRDNESLFGENDWLAAYKPTLTGYKFKGWYTDPACTVQFNAATPITVDTTLYAKWVPEKKTITVRYLYNDGTTDRVLIDPTTIEANTGEEVTRNAVTDESKFKLQGSYYPLKQQESVWVTEDDTAQEIVFHYGKYESENWDYTVRYALRFVDCDDAAKTFEVELSSSTERATYYYQTIANRTPSNLPDGFALASSSSVVVNPSNPTATFYYELQVDDIDITGDEATYDGDEHKSCTLNNVPDISSSSGYGFTLVPNINYLDNHEGAYKNAGSYSISAKLVARKDTNSVTVWKAANNATVTIRKRPIVLISKSGLWNYDGEVHTLDKQDCVEPGEGTSWVSGEGATYLFGVDAFRTEVGESTNVFDYQLNSGTSEGNYTISKVYGTLTVVVETDYTEENTPNPYYIVDWQNAGDSSTYTLTFKKTSNSNAIAMEDRYSSIPAPWADEEDEKTKITKIDLDECFTTIGKSAFAGLTALTALPSLDGITAIGDNAFKGDTKLETIALNRGMTIGIGAFVNSGVATVTVDGHAITRDNLDDLVAMLSKVEVEVEDGKSTTYARIKAVFEGTPFWESLCAVASGTLMEGLTYALTWNDSAYATTVDGTITYTSNPACTLTIAGSTEEGAESDVYAIPNYTGATPAPWNEYAQQITSLTIDSRVNTIGTNAFTGLSSLTTLDISENVRAIHEGAFASSGVTTVTLGGTTITSSNMAALVELMPTVSEGATDTARLESVFSDTPFLRGLGLATSSLDTLSDSVLATNGVIQVMEDDVAIDIQTTAIEPEEEVQEQNQTGGQEQPDEQIQEEQEATSGEETIDGNVAGSQEIPPADQVGTINVEGLCFVVDVPNGAIPGVTFEEGRLLRDNGDGTTSEITSVFELLGGCAPTADTSYRLHFGDETLLVAAQVDQDGNLVRYVALDKNGALVFAAGYEGYIYYDAGQGVFMDVAQGVAYADDQMSLPVWNIDALSACDWISIKKIKDAEGDFVRYEGTLKDEPDRLLFVASKKGSIRWTSVASSDIVWDGARFHRFGEAQDVEDLSLLAGTLRPVAGTTVRLRIDGVNFSLGYAATQDNTRYILTHGSEWVAGWDANGRLTFYSGYNEEYYANIADTEEIETIVGDEPDVQDDDGIEESVADDKNADEDTTTEVTTTYGTEYDENDEEVVTDEEPTDEEPTDEEPTNEEPTNEESVNEEPVPEEQTTSSNSASGGQEPDEEPMPEEGPRVVEE